MVLGKRQALRNDRPDLLLLEEVQEGDEILAESSRFQPFEGLDTMAPRMGRWGLPLESPTFRSDIRVREVFVEVPTSSYLLPNQRVWGHIAQAAGSSPIAPAKTFDR